MCFIASVGCVRRGWLVLLVLLLVDGSYGGTAAGRRRRAAGSDRPSGRGDGETWKHRSQDGSRVVLGAHESGGIESCPDNCPRRRSPNPTQPISNRP